MKVVLFFLGTLIRSMVLAPVKFFIFHGYISLVYFLTYMASSNSLEIYRLIFVAGVITPLMIAIYRGLPLDCLNLEKAVNAEINS